MIGKTAEIAPSACVEISRPIQMLAIVCDADCRTLLSMQGNEKDEEDPPHRLSLLEHVDSVAARRLSLRHRLLLG